MRRPPLAREALSLSPLVKARWTHSSGVERVPKVAAATQPHVILARRPAAERAPDARAGGFVAFLQIEVSIQDDGLVILDGAHAPVL
jgi:hypothetical protein